MPKGNENQGQSLFEQIRNMQSNLGDDFEGFTDEDEEKLHAYSVTSQKDDFQRRNFETLNEPENEQLKQTAERLATLAAHYPKNSSQLAALREHIPDIGKLRKEKMETLRADAGRSGMDKLLNDLFGCKKRAAKAEIKKMRQSRSRIDDRDRSNVVKAPKHSGRGRNIFTAITNKSGLDTHSTRHDDSEEFPNYGKPISFRTKHGILDGTEIPPSVAPNGRVVLVFSGSGNPAEHIATGISDSYCETGATVISFNYRGFGKSQTLDSKGNKIGTPLSEQSLYEDGMEMYKYVRDVMGVSPENITLHGYSLGAAVASHVAANVAEQNRLKMDKNIPVPESRKLGGIVLQSPMKTMYSAAKDFTNSKIAAFFGSWGSGTYNTKENMRRLYQNDPEIPVAYVSGTEASGDYLSLEITNLHADSKVAFPNASVSFGDAAHLAPGAMLENVNEHLIVARDGRKAQLNTDSLQRQGNAPAQEQDEIRQENSFLMS